MNQIIYIWIIFMEVMTLDEMYQRCNKVSLYTLFVLDCYLKLPNDLVFLTYTIAEISC